MLRKGRAWGGRGGGQVPRQSLVPCGSHGGADHSGDRTMGASSNVGEKGEAPGCCRRVPVCAGGAWWGRVGSRRSEVRGWRLGAREVGFGALLNELLSSSVALA